MLPEFELYLADSIEDACRLKSEGALVVAGGTDIYVAMHGGKLRPKTLVDIKNISEMKEFSYNQDTGLTIGALTTHRAIEDCKLINKKYTALYEGCSQVGSVQIRYRGTVGGNICNAAPSADSAGPLLVHNANCVIVGKNGQREILLEDFFTDAKKTALSEDELLYKILVPPVSLNSGSAYFKFTRRKAMDLALLGVSVYLELSDRVIDDVRIALSTAAPTPIRTHKTEEWLCGQNAYAVNLSELGNMILEESNPRSSWRASKEFRLALIKELIQRTYGTALERAERNCNEK